LALTVGALLIGTAIVSVAFQKPNQLPTPLVILLLLLASILIVLALSSMYSLQAEATGWIGLLGHVLLEVGMLFIVIYAAAPVFYPQIHGAPGESVGAFAFGTALMLGLPLTAIATLRAGVYPRWCGILLLAASLGFVFDFLVAEYLPIIAGQLGIITFRMLFASGFAWIGICISTGWTQSAMSLHATR
jgi:hypothetical protein